MGSLIRRFLHLLRPSHHDAELREEIETHRALRQERLEREGLARADAITGSRRALGNVTLAREDARRAWRLPAADDLYQDVRFAFRSLRKNPGVAVAAIVTLALGIGATTAVFSICNSLLIRTLPVREPERLALISGSSWTYPIWQAVDRRSNDLFDGAFAWAETHFNTSASGEMSFIDGAYVSGRTFDLLGLTAVRGRLLGVSDDQVGPGAAVAVITYRFWQERYAGADDVVGHSLVLEGVPFAIVGVMPREFSGPDVGRISDVMVPFGAEPLIRGKGSFLQRPTAWWLSIMARLKPGQSLDQATMALRSVQPLVRAEALPEGLPAAFLKAFLADPFEMTSAATGRSILRAKFRTALLAMFAVVGLVLLIACANIASLLVARALSRRRELAVRLAIGATRGRIARLLLTESLLIAATGAGLGLLFARWSSALLVRQLVSWQNRVSLDLSFDWRVLAFTASVAGLTAIASAIAPALGVRRIAPGEALKEAGRSLMGDRRLTMRGVLVVVQIALSLTLVAAAALFLRTFTSLTNVPLGFSPDALVVASLSLPSGTPGERFETVERLRAAASSMPGVTSAAVAQITPVSGMGWNAMVGEAGSAIDRSQMTFMNATSPGWFHTMGIRVIEGRDFEAADTSSGAPVAIVNESFAKRFLHEQVPVGSLVTIGGPQKQPTYRVVGLVVDSVYETLRAGAVPIAYIPAAPDNIGMASVGTSLTLAVAPGQEASVRRALSPTWAQVSPGVTFSLHGFDEYIRATVVQERLVALLSGFFGALGLLLAGVGLYGVVSHAVSLRRSEIGLRMALGARPAGIVRLVFARVGVLVAIGILLGGALSLWAARFVQAMLFQVDAQDPSTFGLAAAVLTAVAALAAWLPARRAARLDPAQVLREG